MILFQGFGDALAELPTFLEAFFKVSLVSAVFGIIIAFIVGVIFGLFAVSQSKILRGLSRIFVELFQNTPILILLFFLYAFSPYIFKRPLEPLIIGTIVVGVYTSAYVCEIIRSGITSLPKGQFEAAASQGFSYVDTMRYIILPQAFRLILPSLTTQIVSVIKNTSILQCITAPDLMYQAEVWTSYSGHSGPSYIIAAIIYFVACYPLTMFSRYLEKKAKAGYKTKKKEETVDEPVVEMKETKGGVTV